jgi:hypothetical protein
MVQTTILLDSRDRDEGRVREDEVVELGRGRGAGARPGAVEVDRQGAGRQSLLNRRGEQDQRKGDGGQSEGEWGRGRVGDAQVM